MKKFPKPAFQDLLDNYRTQPSSVHDCPRLYRKDSATGDVNVNTCAIRMSEALVIANELIDTRAAIGNLTKRGGTGKGFLLGKYDYRNNLCPHGIARGARDVAYFLKQHWGMPTMHWNKPGEAPKELLSNTGVIAFIKIPGYDGQGHMDVWNDQDCVGHAYFDADKVWFWRLD
jgi:hypothetical protein